MRPILVGIAGGSASGKTTIAQNICDNFIESKSVIIIRQDDYYNDQNHMSMEDRLKVNYDHPFAFDNELLILQLKDLLSNKAIVKPTYDFTNYTRSDKTERIEPCEVIILEGLFILEHKEIRDLLNIKVFVETDSDVRLIRRIKRDVLERGRTIDSVINQYLSTVKPMHDSFIEPSKKYADIIVPEGGKNLVAIDILKTKINSIINHNMI